MENHNLGPSLAPKAFHDLPVPFRDIVWVADEDSAHWAFLDILQKSVIGIDAEWTPGDLFGEHQLALFQIAAADRVYLLDMVALRGAFGGACGKLLMAVLQSRKILKLGFGMADDLGRLYETCPEITAKIPEAFSYEHSFDFLVMLKNPEGFDVPVAGLTAERQSTYLSVLFPEGLERKPVKGLSGLVEEFLGLPLDKTQQISNWQRRPLTEAQMRYAALDAFCLLEVAQKCQGRMHAVGIVDDHNVGRFWGDIIAIQDDIVQRARVPICGEECISSDASWSNMLPAGAVRGGPSMDSAWHNSGCFSLVGDPSWFYHGPSAFTSHQFQINNGVSPTAWNTFGYDTSARTWLPPTNSPTVLETTEVASRSKAITPKLPTKDHIAVKESPAAAAASSSSKTSTNLLPAEVIQEKSLSKLKFVVDFTLPELHRKLVASGLDALLLEDWSSHARCARISKEDNRLVVSTSGRLRKILEQDVPRGHCLEIPGGQTLQSQVKHFLDRVDQFNAVVPNVTDVKAARLTPSQSPSDGEKSLLPIKAKQIAAIERKDKTDAAEEAIPGSTQASLKFLLHHSCDGNLFAMLSSAGFDVVRPPLDDEPLSGYSELQREEGRILLAPRKIAQKMAGSVPVEYLCSLPSKRPVRWVWRRFGLDPKHLESVPRAVPPFRNPTFIIVHDHDALLPLFIAFFRSGVSVKMLSSEESRLAYLDNLSKGIENEDVLLVQPMVHMFGSKATGRKTPDCSWFRINGWRQLHRPLKLARLVRKLLIRFRLNSALQPFAEYFVKLFRGNKEGFLPEGSEFIALRNHLLWPRHGAMLIRAEQRRSFYRAFVQSLMIACDCKLRRARDTKSSILLGSDGQKFPWLSGHHAAVLVSKKLLRELREVLYPAGQDEASDSASLYLDEWLMSRTLSRITLMDIVNTYLQFLVEQGSVSRQSLVYPQDTLSKIAFPHAGISC